MIDPTHGRLLQDRDLALLARAAGLAVDGEEGVRALRSDPERIEALLRHPGLIEVLFGAEGDDPLLHASPFVVFAALVHRVARDLETAVFVDEWQGPNRTLPVFDVERLRAFLRPARHRTLMAELLTSYTRVASGTWWERTERGWRRHRYSELDPIRLAELLDVVPPTQRAAVYRRLGDLALFLSGVFPDHVASHPLQPRQLPGLARLLEDAAGPAEVARVQGPQAGIWLLEWLGRRAYRLTIRQAGASAGELRALVEDFGSARRVLNLLTGRYLYPSRARWFPSAH